MQQEPSFEYYRDAYFINPKNGDMKGLDKVLPGIISSIMGMSLEERSISQDTNPDLFNFANMFAADMKGARRFDHNSMAQLHPADSIPAIIGHFASTLMNNNTIIGDVSPVETRFEVDSISWLCNKVIGYGLESSGSLVSGGTSANNSAMLVAREKMSDKGWDGRTRAVVLLNEMAHYSLEKSIKMLAPHGILGLEKIPHKKSSYAMDIDQLKERIDILSASGINIMSVVAIAGETETGIVENIQDIAEICDEYNLHLHTDGAYGVPFVLSRAKKFFTGIERSDSITCDPHKYLYTPYPNGAILFKKSDDHQLIERFNSDGDDYMFKDSNSRVSHEFKENVHTYLGKRRLEGSMGGQSAASLYATICTLGEVGIGKILNHTLDMTDLLYEGVIEKADFKPLYKPQLNTICLVPNTADDVYLKNPVFHDNLLEKLCSVLEKENGVYISTTTMPVDMGQKRIPRKVVRIVPTHPYTDHDDINFVVETLSERWSQLKEGYDG